MPWRSTHPAFRGIGAGFLLLAIIEFIFFAVLSTIRYVLFPEIIAVLVAHEVHSLFLGVSVDDSPIALQGADDIMSFSQTIPMGFVTIVSGIGFLGEEYGLDTAVAGSGLWWIALGMRCPRFDGSVADLALK